MNYKELKKKKYSDLQKLLNEYRDQLRDMRFKDANKQLKNVREIRKIRQQIAQIITLINAAGQTDKIAPATDNKPDLLNKTSIK